MKLVGKNEGGETFLNGERQLATRREFRTVSNVPGTSLLFLVVFFLEKFFPKLQLIARVL